MRCMNGAIRSGDSVVVVRSSSSNTILSHDVSAVSNLDSSDELMLKNLKSLKLQSVEKDVLSSDYKQLSL